MFKVPQATEGVTLALESEVKPFDPEALNGGQLDTLICLVEHGPCFDGDVPSKSSRDELIEHGYAVRVACKGEAGHTAANEKGCDLYVKQFGGNTVHEAMKNRKAAVAAEQDARDPGDHEYR